MTSRTLDATPRRPDAAAPRLVASSRSAARTPSVSAPSQNHAAIARHRPRAGRMPARRARKPAVTLPLPKEAARRPIASNRSTARRATIKAALSRMHAGMPHAAMKAAVPALNIVRSTCAIVATVPMPAGTALRAVRRPDAAITARHRVPCTAMAGPRALKAACPARSNLALRVPLTLPVATAGQATRVTAFTSVTGMAPSSSAGRCMALAAPKAPA